MKLFASIAAIANKIKHDKINAFAAEAALFIVMSFIPCLILLMLLVKYTPLSEEMVISMVSSAFPPAFVPAIADNVHTVYSEVNRAAFFIVIISTIWAAGKGFVSLIDGLNTVFGIKDEHNWFIKRIYAILYTLIFLVIIVLCIVIYVLGYRINAFLEIKAPFVARITSRILQFRVLIMIVILTLLFTFLYVAIPFTIAS